MCFLKKTTICLFTIFLLVVANHTYAKDFFVSAANTQLGDGSLANPFKTIQQAADVAQPGDVVNIRTGIYREEVKMATDGVTYQSYLNESVTINGTEMLKNWTQIPKSAVYQTTMDFNAPDNESLRHPSNQLFVDQKMIQFARWPNQTSNNLCIPTDAIAEDISVAGNFVTFTVASFNEPDGRWVGATIFLNLSISGNDGQGWTGQVTATSQANHTITFNNRAKPNLQYGPYQMGEQTEFYLFNPTMAGVEATGGVTALLSPGEWWKSGNAVYVCTPNGLAPSEDIFGNNLVEAKKRKFAFTSSSATDNRSDYTIKKLNLFACTISTDIFSDLRNNTIVDDAHNITFDGLNAKYLTHFTNSGGNWQSQWYGRSGFIMSGRNNVIKNCNIQYSAGPGICLLGTGNKILNNTISEVNYACSNAGAISTSYVCIDGEIGYNNIFNTTVMGINFGGLTNSDSNKKGIGRIHHNRIYDCLLRSNDSGYIDATGIEGNWGRMDHNFLYKTFSPKGRYPKAAYGFYFDFNPGKWFVDHNVVYGIEESMLINTSNLLSIYNNTFISPNSSEGNIEDSFNYGIGDTIRNNILSTPQISSSISSAIVSNNLLSANSKANALFQNAPQRNYQLKNTATDAIDKGVNYFTFNDLYTGNVDLGAYEYGTTPWTVGPTTNLPPTIIPNSGDFVNSTPVNFKTDIFGTNVTIRYTINGTTPNLNSPIFTQPFTITDTSLVKAIVFVDNVAVTEIASANIYVTQLADILPIDVIISKPTGTYPVQTFVTISSTGPDVKEIRYTLDGTEPTKYSLNYGGSLIVINETTTIKAKAFGKLITSDIKTAIFTIVGPTVNISPNGGVVEAQTTVTLTPSHFGSTIYFTLDGSIPTTASTIYTNPININNTTTINAIATSNNLIGDVATASFVTSSLQNVVFSPSGGNFIDNVGVSLTTGISNATIYYTTNGETPTTLSTLYNSQPIKVEQTQTIKALAISNTVVGNVTQAVFTISGPNVAILPASGLQTDVFNCTITSIPNAVIYYTIDGSIPTTTSILYTGPIVIDSYVTQIKALAIRNGNVGEVNTVNYTINKPAISISPNGATAQKEVSVSIASSLPNSIIYYTLDGTTPTAASLIYTVPLILKSNVTLKTYAAKGQLQTDVNEAVFNITLDTKLIALYPNPTTNGQFSLRFNRPQQGQKVQVMLYNNLGKLIFKKNVTMVSFATQEEAFNLSFLKPGNYFIKLKTVSAHINNLVNEDIKLLVK
ncbi:MAG: T9SS C-terminal target domain-containing protein [Sphingobacteriales bacterium]|nr:MAG: T9SS C-terminal target domain-containing protein [Sphingobacteriales bacterium]